MKIKPENLLFIASATSSNWVSCKTITMNLLKSYTLALTVKDLNILPIDENDSKSDIFNKVKAVNFSKIKKIIFLDHAPHPQTVIDPLHYFLKQINKHQIDLIFHIYGDFSLFFHQWLSIEKKLKVYNCHFIAASEKQHKLISKLIKKSPLTTSVIPFSVDTRIFKFSEQSRLHARKKLNIKNEHVYLYTGRLSLQKNIIQLLKAYKMANKFIERKNKLYISGSFDDLGSPFFGNTQCKNEFFHSYQNEINSSSFLKENVVWIGNLTQKELREIYCAADSFVSVSLHNDEDFGMSPAEALVSGLPAILSDWAGYSSFKIKESNHCQLVPVSITSQSGPACSTQILTKMIIKRSISKIEGPKERKAISTLYSQHFSILSASEKIKNLLNTKMVPFAGFTSLMQEASNNFSEFPYHPYLEYKTVTNTKPLYSKIYESYL